MDAVSVIPGVGEKLKSADENRKQTSLLEKIAENTKPKEDPTLTLDTVPRLF